MPLSPITLEINETRENAVWKTGDQYNKRFKGLKEEAGSLNIQGDCHAVAKDTRPGKGLHVDHCYDWNMGIL